MRLKRRILTNKDWHKWFAWFPVRISDQENAWLEYVERRIEYYDGYDGTYSFVEYRKLASIPELKP